MAKITHGEYKIADTIPEPDGLDVRVIDVNGLAMIPGLIDAHVHIAGAGGEGGPATRTQEMRLGQMLDGGITTVVGCLGTAALGTIPVCSYRSARSRAGNYTTRNIVV